MTTAACGGGALFDEQTGEELSHFYPPINEAATTSSSSAGLLIDHKGPILPSMRFYLIFWGTGFEPTTKTLYTTFLTGLGQSKYWTIDNQYLRGATNNATFGKAVSDTSTPPTTVSNANLQTEVHKMIAAGGLGPFDPSGLYFVITPANTRVCYGSACSCTYFCGYHTSYFDSKYGNVFYSTIPSAAACPRACGIFSGDQASPNKNVEVDEGVSVIAHEAEETQSDPYGVGWFDSQGAENGDKCAYRYGPTTTQNGARVNQSWGGTKWLVQMNWSNKISGCAQQGPTDGPYSQ